MSKPNISESELEAWLRERFDVPVEDLRPLTGGYWSSAFAFRSSLDELVIRFNRDPTGFEIDAKAMQFESLPVPRILEIGEGLGFHFALSERHHGTFLELFEDEPLDVATNLVKALAHQVTPDVNNVNWFEPDQTSTYSWQDWLLDSLVHAQDSVTTEPAKTVFMRCYETFSESLDECPERRDLVHGDLLHQNVLVRKSGDIDAIFSWKCSVLGDFLFDVAWLELWAPWHPALENTQFGLKLAQQLEVTQSALENAAMRLHLYKLQIGAHHLGWFSSIGDHSNLAKMTSYLEKSLIAGPPAS